MAKYRVYQPARDGSHTTVDIEADTVSFNMDYNMTFFKKDEEVVGSAPMNFVFYKLPESTIPEVKPSPS